MRSQESQVEGELSCKKKTVWLVVHSLLFMHLFSLRTAGQGLAGETVLVIF
jgi:hypothetical protein